MRVAMYYSNNDVRLEEMAKPSAGPGEVLIRVLASGICGSDVMEWYRRHKVPLVLGHEIAGEIAEVGQGVKHSIGERVTASHHVPCNKCRYCLSGHHTACETLRTTNFYPGGFAEYVRFPAINIELGGLYQIPNKVSCEEATFTEPLACVLRAQRKMNLRKDGTLLVIGSGISGLLHINLAKAKNISRIIATDVGEYRMNAARRFGARNVINGKDDVPEKLRELNEGRPADWVIVCAGARSAFEQALRCVDRGGVCMVFAPTDEGVTIPLSVNEYFWRNDTSILTSYAGSPADHLEALELLQAGKLDAQDMITHRFPLQDAKKGFKLVAKAKESIKVIIEPNN